VAAIQLNARSISKVVWKIKRMEATAYRNHFLNIPRDIDRRYWPEHPLMSLEVIPILKEPDEQTRPDKLHKLIHSSRIATTFILYDANHCKAMLGNNLERARFKLNNLILLAQTRGGAPLIMDDLNFTLFFIHDALTNITSLYIMLRMLFCYYEETSQFIKYTNAQVEQLLITPLCLFDNQQSRPNLSELTKKKTAELSEACTTPCDAATLCLAGDLWKKFNQSFSEQEESYINLLKVMVATHRNIAIFIFLKLWSFLLESPPLTLGTLPTWKKCIRPL
jgi:hypothetical protein